MPDEWIIRDEDQETLEQLKCEWVKKIRDSPKGKDPRVVELLNQLETERVASKHYALLEKVIWLLGNDEEVRESGYQSREWMGKDLAGVRLL